MLARGRQGRRTGHGRDAGVGDGGGVDQHRRPRQVAGPFDGREHEGVGAVDGHVAVVDAHRVADHPPGEVLIDRQRPVHHRQVVGQRAGAAVDGDQPEVTAGRAVLLEVLLGVRGEVDARQQAEAGVLGRSDLAPHRVRGGGPGQRGRAVDPVVDERGVARAGEHGVHGVGQDVTDRRQLEALVVDLGEAERGRERLRVDAEPSRDVRRDPADPADVLAGQARVGDGRRRRFGHERQQRTVGPAAPEAGRADADDGDAVLDRVPVHGRTGPPRGTNTGNGPPWPSTKRTATRAPTRGASPPS